MEFNEQDIILLMRRLQEITTQGYAPWEFETPHCGDLIGAFRLTLPSIKFAIERHDCRHTGCGASAFSVEIYSTAGKRLFDMVERCKRTHSDDRMREVMESLYRLLAAKYTENENIAKLLCELEARRFG